MDLHLDRGHLEAWASLASRQRGELARLVERYVEDVALAELVTYGTIPCLSPSFDPSWQEAGHLDAAAERLRAFAAGRRLGSVAAEVVRLEGRTPLLLVEVAPSPKVTGEATTLVYGHLDKQPPLGAWQAGLDPFRPVRLGNRLYGRGMADDGYAPFAALGALEALEAMDVRHGRVVLVVEASEESGSCDLEPALDQVAARLGNVGLVVCLDSGGPTHDRLWVTTSLRGNLVATLTVKVLTEGVHSGMAGGIVPDSFRLLRVLLGRLEDASSGEILLSEMFVPIPAHRRQEIARVADELGEAAMGRFPVVEGLSLEGASVAERIERATWRPALTVTGADGLPSLAGAGNVLRPSTSLKLSLRLPPTLDATRALATIQAVLTADPPKGAHIELHFEAPAQGFDAPPLAPWLSKVLDAASRAHFKNAPGALGLGGSIPFLATLARRYPDAQWLATGVLGPESNAHGPNEALDLGVMKALTCCLAEILAAASDGSV